VNGFIVRVISGVIAVAVWVAPAGAQRWKMQYFYDKNKSTFLISDLQFASASRGVAAGIIQDGNHRKPTAVVTADGGEHWQLVPLEEPPVSLFFLNENLGWMVTTKGLWRTQEAGKSWHHVAGLPAGMVRVYFQDENYGFAVGGKKKVLETHDGGKSWQPVPAAAQPPGMPEHSVYNWVAFASPKVGLITGWNQPPRRTLKQFPDWMDPEAAMNQRELPHLSYELITTDGGKTWKPGSASLFGDVARVRFGKSGNGIGLIEYTNAFRYPSEAYRIDWTTGKSQTVYRDRRFAISDIWLTQDGVAYLAGILVPGQVRDVIPGKVQVLKSNDKDFSTWSEMDVDYRAVANRTTLAVVDANNMWLATNNGMILKLVP